jgi:hypothetical protein
MSSAPDASNTAEAAQQGLGSRSLPYFAWRSSSTSFGAAYANGALRPPADTSALRLDECGIDERRSRSPVPARRRPPHPRRRHRGSGRRYRPEKISRLRRPPAAAS